MEELTKPTLAEGILMDILKTAETGTTVVQEVETKMADLEKRAKPTLSEPPTQNSKTHEITCRHSSFPREESMTPNCHTLLHLAWVFVVLVSYTLLNSVAFAARVAAGLIPGL